MILRTALLLLAFAGLTGCASPSAAPAVDTPSAPAQAAPATSQNPSVPLPPAEQSTDQPLSPPEQMPAGTSRKNLPPGAFSAPLTAPRPCDPATDPNPSSCAPA